MKMPKKKERFSPEFKTKLGLMIFLSLIFVANIILKSLDI